MLKLTLINIAIFQGIVIGLIFLHSSFFKSKANQYLAFAIFSLSWSLFKMVLGITKLSENFPYLRFLEAIDSELLFPVFILFFVIHKVDHPQKHSKKLGWLFLPSMISTLSVALIHYNSYISKPTTDNLDFINAISIILLLIVFLVILFFIPFILFKTYKFIQHSTLEQEKKWLSYLWYFEVAALGILMVLIFISPFILSELSTAMQMLALFATLIIHWISYTGVYKLKLINDQKKIRILLNNRIQITTEVVPDNPSQVKDAKLFKEHISTIKESKKLSKENSYYKELEQLCFEQKIYRDSTVDRNKIAEMLGISPSYVSQLINSITGENFSTYINRHRVEEVKKLIVDKDFDNYSLLSIGLECGFSSKTTYYNWFKKITGMTPNAYRKAQQ